MGDEEVRAAMPGSFLGKLPPDVVRDLTTEGERVDYPAGIVVYRESSAPGAALVIAGLVRVSISSPEGRQVTVRYARAGDVLGIAVMVGGPVNVSVQTLEASSLFRINLRTLTAGWTGGRAGRLGDRRGAQPAALRDTSADSDQCVWLGQAAPRPACDPCGATA